MTWGCYIVIYIILHKHAVLSLEQQETAHCISNIRKHKKIRYVLLIPASKQQRTQRHLP